MPKVLTSTVCDNSLLERVVVVRQELVKCTSEFERAGLLMIFTL